LITLASLHSQLGDLESANTALQRLEATGKETPAVMLTKLRMALANSPRELAAEILNEFAKTEWSADEDYRVVQTEIAELAMAFSEIELAEACYQRLVERGLDDLNLWKLGFYLAQQQSDDPARLIKFLDQVKQAQGESALWHSGQALLAIRSVKKNEQAIEIALQQLEKA
jgi:tetratricopeptide (TPR) repeat protein